MTSRNVSVTRLNQAVGYIDRHGVEQHMGVVGVDEFVGEGIRKIVFEPSSDNPWANGSKKKSGYSLGFGTSALDVINPADVQRIIVDFGFQPKSIYAGYGGLELSALYLDQDHQFLDPIEYDLDFWGSRGEVGSLFPGVQVDTSLYIGRMSARISVGIYRLVCSNGMMIPAMGFPRHEFPHSTWDLEKVRAALLEPEALPRAKEIPDTTPVCSTKALQLAVDFLQRYRDAKKSPTGLTTPMVRFEQTYKPLTESTLYGWALENYTDHLKYVVSGRSGGEVRTVDLVNAFTSAINAHRLDAGNDRGVWSTMWPMERVIDSTVSLASFAEMFTAN